MHCKLGLVSRNYNCYHHPICKWHKISKYNNINFVIHFFNLTVKTTLKSVTFKRVTYLFYLVRHQWQKVQTTYMPVYKISWLLSVAHSVEVINNLWEITVTNYFSQYVVTFH